jgi:hypothetical protein
VLAWRQEGLGNKGDSKGGKPKAKGTDDCRYCGKPGRYERECRKKKADEKHKGVGGGEALSTSASASASDTPKKVSGGIFAQPSEKLYVMGASATVGGVRFNVASSDSGSDADTFTRAMAHFGRQVVDDISRLHDIQGGGIRSYGAST